MKENGYYELTDPGSDKVYKRAATTMCVHCGGHFEATPGSGRIRGFCYRCNGAICSFACAQKCVPRLQRIINMEAGLPEDYESPILIAVPSTFELSE
jgi:hypothetical protein